MTRPLTIAYVLVDRGTGRYPLMACVSIAAARRVQPHARIVLVCDEETVPHLREKHPDLLDALDQIIPLASSIPSLRARSFYFKTRVRDLVEGDLAYLDSDTLPIRPFADIFDDEWDFALVQDRNHHCPITPTFPHWEMERMRKMGWDCPLPKYFNAGIYFLRDNPAVRTAVADWQRRWEHSWSFGDDWDQLALNCSVHTLPVRVRELSPAYNAMVGVHPVYARGAKIYHFFIGNVSDLGDSLFEHLLRHYQATRTIDWASIDHCVAIDHPWMPPYWPRRLWQTGNYGLALRHFAARIGKKLLPRKPNRIPIRFGNVVPKDSGSHSSGLREPC
ncbi:MAG: hypothetical protein ACRELG_12630 [Gemmataceae bacterium]